MTGQTTIGLILAGGRSTRMGGRDKALLTLAGHPLLAHAVRGLQPQVDVVAISSNAPAAIFAPYGLTVLPDCRPDFPGPLAGIEAGLRQFPDCPLLAVAVDLPRLPGDLAARLAEGLGNRHACAYASDGQHHALAILFRPGSERVVRDYLDRGGRNLRDFLAAHGMAVIFDRPADRGLFMNLNTPEDLVRAERDPLLRGD
jgi:molybdopterin-guanine dinucleotide biosynthesis protein A